MPKFTVYFPFPMKKFWIDVVIGTIFVFAVLWGLSGITHLALFNAFDPVGKALSDMEFTDIAFSQIREDPAIDTNIVIVNIGELPRGGIAQQIMTLNHFKPKVIALDIIFSCEFRDSISCPGAYDTLGTMMFGEAVRQAEGRMVLAHKLWQKQYSADNEEYDSLEHTDEPLREGAYEGFVNLDTDADKQEDLKICRALNPSMMVNGKRELGFSTKIAMLYDSNTTKQFLERGNVKETINYRGNIVDWHNASNYAGRYSVLDWDQALDTSSFVGGMIKDKIVILGFLGKDLRATSWEDKFITPLNKNYAGKTRPDMYGVVVHANAVSMILNKDYIDVLEEWQQIAIAIIICFLNVALFSLIHHKLPKWFDILTILIQLFQILLLALLMMYVFSEANFKLNLSLTLLVLAVVGTCYEIYESVIKTLIQTLRARRLFTKRKNRVLTP
jgi:CHASE2 domain-containing sensor protein